jgi:hypothetical protein
VPPTPPKIAAQNATESQDKPAKDSTLLFAFSIKLHDSFAESNMQWRSDVAMIRIGPNRHI